MNRAAVKAARLEGVALGIQLAEQRERAGLTVEQAARRAGMSADTWRGLETGLGGIVGMPTWVAAAHAVGCRLRSTLAGPPEQRSEAA